MRGLTLGIALAFWLTAASVEAQVVQFASAEETGTVDALNETVEIDVAGYAALAINFHTTVYPDACSASTCNQIFIEATITGSSWFLISGWQPETGIWSFGGDGGFDGVFNAIFGVSAYKRVRARLGVLGMSDSTDVVIRAHAAGIPAVRADATIPTGTAVTIKDWDTNTQLEVNNAGQALINIPGYNTDGFGSSGPNSIDALNDEMIFNTFGFGTWNVRMFGTWVGTIQIEGGRGFGNGEFSTLVCNDAVTGATQSTFTANATVICSTAGLQYVKLRASAWTSGLAYPAGFLSGYGDRLPVQPVLQSSGPWTQNLTQWNSVAIASPFDLDTGGGTQNIPGVSLRASSSGGSVELGTSTNPIRTDPTNATTTNVNCVSGCVAGGSFTDNSAFTAGTTAVSPIGGVFNDGLADVTSGNAAAPRITKDRGLHINLRDNDGTEIGTAGAPIRVDPTGTTTQPVDVTDRTARVLGRAFLRNPGDTANMGDATTPVRVDPTGTTTQPSKILDGTAAGEADVVAALPASSAQGLVVRTPAASFDSGLIVSIPSSITTVTSSTIRLRGILVVNKAGGGRRITVTNLAGDAYLENTNVPANSSVFVEFGNVTVVGLRWFQSSGAAGSLNAQAVGEQ